MLILVILVMIGLVFGFILLGKITVLPKEIVDYNTLVSVIISTEKPDKQLRKCLAALHNQNYHKIELILAINDPSEWDETQRNSYFNTIQVMANTENQQDLLYRCANQAQGELFLFIDSSVLLKADALKRLVTLFYRKYAIISVGVAQSKLTLKQILNLMQVNSFRYFNPPRKKQGLFEAVYLIPSSVYFENTIHMHKIQNFGLDTGLYLSNKAIRIYNIYGYDSFFTQETRRNTVSLLKTSKINFINSFMIFFWLFSYQLIYVLFIICFLQPIWILPVALIYLLQALQFVYFNYNLFYEQYTRAFFYPFYFIRFFHLKKEKSIQAKLRQVSE